MYFSLRLGVSLLAMSGAALAFRIDQPHATPINKRFDANGWTPLPTSNPEPMLQLFKRQANPALCGYLDGDGNLPITCGKSSSCLRNPSLSWFGCCTGTSITDCEVYTACVESKSVSACSSRSACANDKFRTACTASASPFCATLYKTVSGAEYGHFVCAASDTSFEIFSTSKGSASGSSSSRPISSSSRNSTMQSTRSSSSSKKSSSTSTGTGSSSSAQTVSTISSTSAAQGTDNSKTQMTAPGQPTNQGAPTQSSISAEAKRTAEAVVGIIGGVVGVLALVL